jgi:hypothetical protein
MRAQYGVELLGYQFDWHNPRNVIKVHDLYHLCLLMVIKSTMTSRFNLLVFASCPRDPRVVNTLRGSCVLVGRGYRTRLSGRPSHDWLPNISSTDTCAKAES